VHGEERLLVRLLHGVVGNHVAHRIVLLLGHTHGLAIIGILLGHIVLDCCGEGGQLPHGLLRRVPLGGELATSISLGVWVGGLLGGSLIEEILLLGILLWGRLILVDELFRLEVRAGSALTLIANQSGHRLLTNRLGLLLHDTS